MPEPWLPPDLGIGAEPCISCARAPSWLLLLREHDLAREVRQTLNALRFHSRPDSMMADHRSYVEDHSVTGPKQ